MLWLKTAGSFVGCLVVSVFLVVIETVGVSAVSTILFVDVGLGARSVENFFIFTVAVLVGLTLQFIWVGWWYEYQNRKFWRDFVL